MKRTLRFWALLSIVTVFLIALALRGPIPQDASYHAFADQRTIFGIPNFWNVVSNVPFLVVGVAGLLTLRRRDLQGGLPTLYPAYALFFVGAILIFFGSSAYHRDPDNSTLALDRLPMTLAFMAFLAIIAGEHIDESIGRRSLPYLALLGVGTVFYWWVNGDLRPYFVAQFLPMALIPAMLLIFPSAFSKVYLIWGVIGAYAVAKVLELFDRAVYANTFLSGHTLKHLTSAAAMYLMVVALRRRRRVAIKTDSAVPAQLFAE